MAATIIDGKRIARRMKESVKRDIKNIKPKGILELAALHFGGSASCEIYLNRQKMLADELGIKYCLKTLPAKTSQRKAEQEIAKLNDRNGVTGIIIHTPTPRQIDLAGLWAKIAPDKDIEGLNPVNIGKLIYGDRRIAPPTASACMDLIGSTGVNLRGKEVVIVGHSEIVGRPLVLMLLSEMATTTVCHIGTYEKRMLKSHVQGAEILIVSVGKSRLIKGGWIRKGAVVIDVGINRRGGKITGDVEFSRAAKRASYITPVPGGVGPVTAITLMKNLVLLHKARKKS